MDEIIFAGIAHAIFTIVFIISRKNRSIIDNTLILWMMSLAMTLIVRQLGPDVWDINVPIIDKIYAYPLCFGPFLWLYVKCVTGDIKTFRLSCFYHFLPFLIAMLYQSMLIESPIYPEFKGTSTDAISIENLIILINILSLLCYSSVVVLRLKKHRHQILNNFSSLSTDITLRWLVWLTCGFIFAYILPLSTLISSFYSHGIALTGFVFILSFFGLK